MHTARVVTQAIALLVAKQSELLYEDAASYDASPSYTDGVCDNELIAHLPFCNNSLSIDARVDDLVARIPLEETFGLLVNNASHVESVHLPTYGWWSEGLHGVALSPAVEFDDPTPVATSFPQVISLAASFNRTLFYDVGAAISTEARAFYNAKHAGLTFWTPNVNIFRDPRWGRGQETPGEDPYLTSEYAVAFVRGLQGEAPEHRNSSATTTPSPFLKVSATCKHFSSYSQEVPRHRNDAIVTKRDQLDTYFPAFESCVKRGHVSAIMCSYNAVNGIPACADKALLTDVVRTQWGFDGYIVSDCGAVADVIYEHHFTQTPEQTVATTIGAGMDLNCGDFVGVHAKKALEAGLLRKPTVHKALKHLFRVQMRLGMFEQGGQPFADITPQMIDTPAHRQLALEAARQAIVLLKNMNATLPLTAKAFTSEAPLAFVGPHFDARDVLLGNYQGIPSHIVTPLEGAAAYTAHITSARGCKVAGEKVPDFDDAEQVIEHAARVVLFVGLDQTQEREEIDRTHLTLPGFQTELIELALRRAKEPVVLVVIAGGGVDLSAYKNHPMVGAIVFAGYLGQAGGQAIADMLFGAYSPSGKLTQMLYSNEFTKHVSIYDMNMRPTPATGNPGRTHRFLSKPELAVYWFGEGGLYTNISIAWESAQPQTIVRADAVRRALESTDTTAKASHFETVNATVTNIGTRASEYVFTLFVGTPDGGTDGVLKWQLAEFGRTPLLQPHEKFRFEFKFSLRTFAVANARGEWEVREGTWVLQAGVGPSATHLPRHEVIVTSATDQTRASASDADAAAHVKSDTITEQLAELRMHGVDERIEDATAVERA